MAFNLVHFLIWIFCIIYVFQQTESGYTAFVNGSISAALIIGLKLLIFRSSKA